MFGKWFDSAYTGSMAGAGADVFAVFTYAVAHAKADATVELNPLVVAALIGMPVENVERAVEFLLRPDPKSRNPEHDGRRLLFQSGHKYLVVSKPVYRRRGSQQDVNIDVVDSERREYLRVKQQESRARRKSNVINSRQLSIVDSQLSQHLVNQEEEEKEEERTKKKRKKKEIVHLPPDQLAGTLPLIDGSEYEISKSQIKEWAEAFPGIDIRQQMRVIKAWCNANPRELWTRGGISRAIFGWLKREQDNPKKLWAKPGGANGRPTAQSKEDAINAAFRR